MGLDARECVLCVTDGMEQVRWLNSSQWGPLTKVRFVLLLRRPRKDVFKLMFGNCDGLPVRQVQQMRDPMPLFS